MGGTLPDPSALAVDVLRQSTHGGPPARLDRVVRLWPGLQVSEDAINNSGYLVDLGIRGGQIIIRSSDRVERRRYTLAHEIGHWILNLQAMSATGASVERWCDTFAANLLMPTSWVRGDLAKAERSSVLDLILQGPRRYEVSHQAFWLGCSSFQEHRRPATWLGDPCPMLLEGLGRMPHPGRRRGPRPPR